MKRFAVNVDDINEELFNEMLTVADVGNNHRAAMEFDNPQDAAEMLCKRLIPFFEERMYEADENGYPLEWSE